MLQQVDSLVVHALEAQRFYTLAAGCQGMNHALVEDVAGRVPPLLARINEIQVGAVCACQAAWSGRLAWIACPHPLLPALVAGLATCANVPQGGLPSPTAEAGGQRRA